MTAENKQGRMHELSVCVGMHGGGGERCMCVCMRA